MINPLGNKEDQKIPRFILHDFWKVGESNDYQSVEIAKDDKRSDQETDQTETQTTISPGAINKDWWSLLSQDTTVAIIGLTGIAFSLIRASRKDVIGLKSRYDDVVGLPSIPSKIGIYMSITKMPKKIEFAHNVLESIAGVLSRNSDALKVVMIPALNFKRAIAKGDRNDPVADGYLNMLAMLSLQLTGMKPIKLIVDLAKEYRMSHIQFLKQIAHKPLIKSILKLIKFLKDNKPIDQTQKDPASEWARCIDQGYYTDLAAIQNPELYGFLVAIYINAFPQSNIMTSPTATKLKSYIDLYADIGRKFHNAQFAKVDMEPIDPSRPTFTEKLIAKKEPEIRSESTAAFDVPTDI